TTPPTAAAARPTTAHPAPAATSMHRATTAATRQPGASRTGARPRAAPSAARAPASTRWRRAPRLRRLPAQRNRSPVWRGVRVRSRREPARARGFDLQQAAGPRIREKWGEHTAQLRDALLLLLDDPEQALNERRRANPELVH